MSGADGVGVLREGAIVFRPVSSPVEAAFADESGAIVFVTPDPDLFLDHWPDPNRGGGHTLWRLHPAGTLDIMFRAGTTESPAGGITLFQVVAMTALAEQDSAFRVTPIVVADATPYVVLITPAPHVILWPRDPLGEGIVTGVGWQDHPEDPGGRLVVAVRNRGEAWLEGRYYGFGTSLGYENWNPIPRGTPCPDDPTRRDCLGTATTLPGTHLIAYTETDSQQKMTSLVVFDSDLGEALMSLPVAAGTTVVKFLHASGTQVVVSLLREEGSDFTHLPAIVVDIEAGATTILPIAGLTTIVP